MSAPGGGFNLATVYVQVLPSMRGFSPPLIAGAGRAGGAAGERAGSSFGSSFKRSVGAAMKGAGGIAVAALGAGGALAKFGVQGAANLETVTASFTSLLGSSKAAQDQITALTKFAATTPFETKDIFGYAQQFYALADSVGLSKKQVIPFLTTIGDLGAVTGASSQNISNAVTAIGQIGSAGKVTLDNLNQISEAFPGFNGAAAIASAEGKTTAQVMQEISKGEVAAKDAIPALLTGMQNFKGAAGAMSAQGKTLAGTFSTFKDTIAQATTKAFTPLIPTIKSTLDDLTPVIGQTLSTVAPAIATFAKSLAPVLGPLASGLGDALTAVFQALGPVLQALSPVIKPLVTAFIALIQAISPIVRVIAEIIGTVGPPLLNLFTNLAGTLAPVVAAFADALQPVLPIIATALRQLSAALQPVLAQLGSALKAAIIAIAPSLPAMATAFAAMAIAVAGVFQALSPLIPVITNLVARLITDVFVRTIVTMANAFTLVLRIVTPLLGPLAKLASVVLPVIASVMRTVGNVFNTVFRNILVPVFRGILNLFLTVVGGIVRGAANMFGWVPGVGGKLRSAANSINSFRDYVDRQFKSIAEPNITPQVNVGPALQNVGLLTNALTRLAAVAAAVSGGAKKGFLSGIGNLIAGGAASVPTFPIPTGGGGGGGAGKGGGGGKASKAKPAAPPAFDKSTLLSYLQGATGAQTNPLDAALSAILSSAKASKKKVSGSFVKKLQAENAKMKKAVADRAKVAVQLQAAQAKLAAAQQQLNDKAASISSATVGSFNIASSGTGFDGNQAVSFSNILAQIKQTVVRATKFTATLKKLRKEGLSKVLVAQLAEAGPDALPQALALASATPKQLAQVNSQYKALGDQGASLGKFVANDLYKAGVDSAEGLVRGLQSKQSRLVAAIKKLGAVMIAQLKKTLKIKSPSKVMHGLGEFTVEGFRNGIAAKYGDVQKAGDKLGKSALTTGGGLNGATFGSGGAYLTREEFAAEMAAERAAFEKKTFVLVAREKELARSVANGQKQLGRIT